MRSFNFYPKDFYAGINVYSGQYGNRIWTQAGDDCEGNSNHNPAADIQINYLDMRVTLIDGDGVTYHWSLKPEEGESDQDRYDWAAEQLHLFLEAYYDQFIEQKRFIRKEIRA